MGTLGQRAKFNSILSISQQAVVPKLRYKAQEPDRVLSSILHGQESKRVENDDSAGADEGK